LAKVKTAIRTEVNVTSLNETCGEVLIVNYFYDTIPIQNGQKQGDALLPLLFIFTLEYAKRKFKENQVGPKLSAKNRQLVYAVNVNQLRDNINIINKKHRNFN
jgi:hypothetical protein